jgi:hypothetical protein
MKKIIAGLMLLALMMAGCSQGPSSLQDIVKKVESVDKIVIRSGSTGEFQETTDPDQIADFLDWLNSIQLSDPKYKSLTMGWSWHVDLYQGEKVIVRLVPRGEALEIGNKVWQAGKDLSEGLASFYQTLALPEDER